jgi:hypothetical protein
MSGTLPGIANSQQHDINGQPLSNCLLTVFTGGTTAPAATFQDIGLAIPAQNPLVGDASGRIPLFFVADGTYHVRLTDQFGIMSNGGFDLPQVPSIGASSSGGGGGSVDPTTVASTGDLKWRLEAATIPGWVRINGRTIGNAASGASERANADTQALFIYVWQTYADALCPVPGGRGAGALIDYNSNHQITLLDARDRSIFGLDDMGNVALGGLNPAPFTNGNASAPGSSGGENSHILSTAELAAHVHANTLTDPGHLHPIAGFVPQVLNLNYASSGNQGGVASNENTGSSVTGITINNASVGSNGAHNNIPLFLLGTLYWKL